MQDLSFDPHDRLFTFNGIQFAVQLFTFENMYGLPPERCETSLDTIADRFTIQCSGLTWAGGQEQSTGTVTIDAQASRDRTTFRIDAQIEKTIRSVKLILKGLPDGEIVNLRETDHYLIPDHGLRLHYPDGWRGLYTPLVILKAEHGRYLYVRSLDAEVRSKRFIFLRQTNGLDIELIFEELAPRMETHLSVPAWEVGYCDDPQTIMREHAAFIERTYALSLWTDRADVPAWARQISLVAAIHCQHWTGYIFNDYAKITDSIRWLADRLPPEQLLVYLPGWEGRYYWQYGDYRPDRRMGGESGFADLIRKARDLGVHVMPMFGINVVNKGQENFERWGTPALSMSPGGMIHSGSVDWDGSRHYDHGWGVTVNPGAPTWQLRLSGQINQLIDRYGFDSVFLDISAGWHNDPRYAIYPGTADLIRRIQQAHPNTLIAGEGWYDAMAALTPLMQSGHTEGVLHWHDAFYSDFFDAHSRSFAHLCLGDPGRGSTGVHELGYNPIRRSPLRKGIIPTVTIVEDTLQVASAEVNEIIAEARQYALDFLTPVAPTNP